MKLLSSPPVHGLLLGLLLCLSPMMQAQETVTLPRKEYDVLKRQAAEAAGLRDELERTRAELSRLKQSNHGGLPKPVPVLKPSPTTESASAPGTVAAPRPSEAPAPAAQPQEPAVKLEPLGRDETVDTTEVIRHYAQGVAGAKARYESAPVKLRGVVAAFDKPSFRRDYEIVFRTDAGQLVCRVQPPAEYVAVFTTRSGSVLSGRTERGAQLDLLKVGDVATIEADGQGVDDGVIRFTRGKLLGVR